MLKLRNILGVVVFVGLVAGGSWLVLNRQLVLDHVRVWQYQPSQDIATLAHRATMTDKAKFSFYLAQPRLENAAQFNQDCRRVEQASPIVGCYAHAKETIHIYNVQNAELDGIKEVTAAHEMLHVAWSRYSAEQRRQLGELLEAAYTKVKTKKLEERMAYYERAQPGTRANELHSILGTEFADLGSELEAHYAEYFSNRAALLKLHAQYNEKFTSAEAEADALTASLDQRKREIEQLTAAYHARINAYSQDVATFNQRAAGGGFQTQAEFQTERNRLSQRGLALRHERQAIKDKVDTYNADVEKLNVLGHKIDQLNQSLDSQKAVK